MPSPKSQFCPLCNSTNIREQVRKGNWRCVSCVSSFAAPRRTGGTKSGSGVVAPLSYRHQLLRDELSKHEKDKAKYGHSIPLPA